MQPAGGRAHAAHNRRRQRDFEGGNRIVKAFYIIQAGGFGVFGKQAHRHQDVKKLRRFKDLAGNAVLHQVLAFQLLDGGVGESQVAVVVDVRVEFVEFFAAVIGENVAVVAAGFGEFGHMVVKMRRLVVAVSYFAQVENRQPRSEILVIRRFFGNQVGCGLDDGFVDVVGADAVVKLDVRFEFDLGNRYVVQAHCRPSYHAVDFVQINRLKAAVAFGNFEIGCRIHRAFLRFGVLNRMGVGLELVFRRFSGLYM